MEPVVAQRQELYKCSPVMFRGEIAQRCLNESADLNIGGTDNEA